MAEMELGMERLKAALGPCTHANALPVQTLVSCEVVAWLCPDCDRQLPALWGIS